MQEKIARALDRATTGMKTRRRHRPIEGWKRRPHLALPTIARPYGASCIHNLTRSVVAATALEGILTCSRRRSSWTSQLRRGAARDWKSEWLLICEGATWIWSSNSLSGIQLLMDRSSNQKEAIEAELPMKCKRPILPVRIQLVRSAKGRDAISFRGHLQKGNVRGRCHPTAFTGCPSSSV